MSQLLAIQNKSLITTEEMEILRNSKFKGFSDSEVAFCAKVVNQLNLSPFLNQIHFARHASASGQVAITTIVGIDGIRLSAQRAGGYAGSDVPAFEYDENDKLKTKPLLARVTVYKIVQGVRCPFVAEARWSEYLPGDSKKQFMWNKMPHNQLAKCAEALALRKAFPAELSSVYAEEEMEQATLGGVHPVQPEAGDGDFDPSISTEDALMTAGIIPYGTHARKKLTSMDPALLRDYVTKIEDRADKMGKELTDKQKITIDFISYYLTRLENGEDGEVF